MKPIYLKTERLRQNLTQEQLEAKSGVNQNHISRLEKGMISAPGADTLLQLSAALDIDPRALRFGPDPRAERKAS